MSEELERTQTSRKHSKYLQLQLGMDSVCSKPEKKKHIQRLRSPSWYHAAYRPRFEGRNFHSRFRIFREERVFQRPQYRSLHLKPRAAHTNATDAPVPSTGDRSSLSFTVLRKAKRESASSVTRKRAIKKKQEQIEEVYRQDCDTFGMVVKMLVEKDPSLEKPIQLSLRENLRDIGTRCIQAMEQFIQEYDSRERGAASTSRRPSIS
nr:uncharacterized protein LOC100332221 [Danio rerio]|eukprot:XP_017213052.1 uncharacterized protein LOC100332221 [Danio rerio]